MNRTFKVVFNKARGALMVANEVTSSVQKKGAKTVIAAAAAVVAGSALAAGGQWQEVPTGDTVLNAAVTSSWDAVQEKNVFTWKVTEGEKTPAPFLSASDEKTFSQELWVIGKGASAQASGIWATGEAAKLTNTGKIYVTTGEGGATWQNAAVGADNGATVTNQGEIVVKGAHGMRIGTTGASSKIVNDVSGVISVIDTGVGMELGGYAGSTAINRGVIQVGVAAEDIEDVNNGEVGFYTHGVQFETQNNTFTNEGKINASDATSAIYIKDGAAGSVVNLVDGSDVNGLIKVDTTDAVFNVIGNTDTLEFGKDEDNTAVIGELNVTEGSSLTLADGTGTTFKKTTIEDSTLTASIWQSDNKFKEVTVGEGGVFNITKLNSGGDADQGKEGAKPHNRLLIAYGNNWTLNGGELQVGGAKYNGALKVGASDTEGALTIEAGSYSYDSLELGKQGSVTVTAGELTVGDLSFSLGNTDNKGTVKIESEGTLTINGTLTAGGTETSLENNGTLKTSSTNFFNKDESGESWVVSSNVDKVSGTGIIDFIDVKEYSLQALRDTQAQFDGQQIIFSNGQFVLGEDKLTADQVQGLILADQIGEASEKGEFEVSGNTTLAGVNFGSATSATVGATDGKLTLVGNEAGDIFEFAEDSKVGEVVATNVQLGTDAASKGQVNVAQLTVNGKLDVAGSYTANAVMLENGAQATVSGEFDVANLVGTSTGTMTVADGGILSAGLIAAKVNMTGNGTLVLGDVPPVVALNEGTQPQIEGAVEITGTGNVLTTNRTAGDALKAAIGAGEYGEGTEEFNGFYVDKTVSVGENGKVVIGEVGDRGLGSISVGKDVVTIVDMNAFSSGDVVFDVAEKLVFNNEGKGVLANLYSTKTVTWVNGVDDAPQNTQAVFKSSNAFLDVTFNKVEADQETDTAAHTDLVVSVNTDVTTDAGLKGALNSVLAEGANLDNQKVLAAIGDKNSGFVNEAGNALTAAGVQATKEYLTAPVTAGTYNVAYDSAALISNTLIQRNLEVKNGLGVWADVFYGSNETDTLYGSSGYSSDIYGGMLGVDMAFGEGARVGAALSIGSGDADSEGSVSKYSSDADFWGLSLYAGKDIGGLTFTADMSYLWLDNDISGTVAGASASESIDSTVFTIGGRADWVAYEGDVMQVVPHVGIRWANIDVDDYRGLNMGSMDVFEMPVGVTVKGNFRTASGWTVTPAIDFTAAPQIGDTEVETLVGDVDVIDNVYNATIGVSAGNDTMRFGLDYKYGFGNNGRANNTFNLKASYLF